MMHYSAGVATVRSIQVSVGCAKDPIVRRDLRNILCKAMETEQGYLTGFTPKPSEQRVIENFDAWINEVTDGWANALLKNEREDSCQWLQTPAFFYANLSTGTNLMFLAVKHNPWGMDISVGDSIRRTLVSLS